MVMFTADEIADLHDTYVEALPDTCTITNPVAVGSPPDVVTDVSCAVLRTTRNTLDGAGIGSIAKPAEWTITVRRGTNVTTGATIAVDGGRSYKAGEIVNPASYSPAIYVQVTELS